MGGITSVGVVTKDRPASLGHALDSCAANLRRFDRRCAFVVADGSRRSGAAAANLRALAGLKNHYGATVYYAGPQEKRVFTAAMVKEGVSRRIMEFALFGHGNEEPNFGANRNAILLHTAGNLVFCPDDDVWCRPAALPRGAGDALVFGTESNPEEWRFFATRGAALSAVRFEDADVLEPHERFLGKTLRGPYTGRAVATLSGLVGDCALSSPHLYFRLEGSSRRRLLRSPASWKSALSREVLRAAARPTAATGTSFTTSAAALDNRSLLPPFSPMFRNEDGLFGATLKKCRPESYFVHLPQAFVHAPPEDRSFSPKDFREVFPGHRANDFLCHCLSAIEPAGAAAENRLRHIGRRISDAAARKDFHELIRERVRRAQALQLLQLERLLELHGRAPKFWAEELERYCLNLEKSLLKNEVPPLGPGIAQPAAWAKFRSFARGYGELLNAWPDILRAVGRLREKGIELGRPI